MDLDAADLQELVRTVRDLGEELARRRAALAVGLSKGGVDVVTKADTHSEEVLVAHLARRFPGDGICAEEGSRSEGGGRCWHIDPLDGTANYLRGLPDWAISVGLAEEGRPIAGVIVAPELGLSWWGDGRGVFCNGRACAPASPAEEPGSWLVGSDNPWDLAARARNLAFVSRLAGHIRMPLMRGSAAVALGLLVSGRLDAYCLAKAYSWDYCAGAALASACGYTLLDWQGAPWEIGSSSLLACRLAMEELLLTSIVESQTG